MLCARDSLEPHVHVALGLGPINAVRAGQQEEAPVYTPHADRLHTETARWQSPAPYYELLAPTA